MSKIKGLDELDKIEESQPGFFESKPELTELSEAEKLDLEDVQEEVELQEKFGDSPVQTAAEAALSSATFGLSDQALIESGLVDQQDLRERRQRNEKAALLGEVAGIVAPAIASGGSSLLAKGVAKAGAGVVGASKANQLTSKFAKKLIDDAVLKSGNKKFAKEVIAKSVPEVAGSAVEGSLYGLGELIKEDALGTAEFNAENAIAHAGLGALFGGAAGGVIGAGSAIIPVIKNNKVTDYVVKKINSALDVDAAAWKLVGETPLKTQRLKSNNPSVFDNGKEFLAKRAKIKPMDSKETVYKKIQDQVDVIGKEIGDTVDAIDAKYADVVGVFPTKKQFADELIDDITAKLKSETGDLSLSAKQNKRQLEKQISEFRKFGSQEGRVTANDIKKFKTEFQKQGKYGKAGELTFTQDLNRKMGSILRDKLFKLADSVSGIDSNLAETLMKANLDYATALTMASAAERKAAKELGSSTFGGLKDILSADLAIGAASMLGGGPAVATAALATKKFIESDFRRSLQILSSVEKSNQTTQKNIIKSIKNFFSESSKVAKKAAVPTSTKALMSSQLLKTDEEGKKIPKPKNRKEAFEQTSKALLRFQQDPQLMVDKITKKVAPISVAAPATAEKMQITAIKGMDFLISKLPKDPNQSTALDFTKRRYEPSSSEVAKFERYFEAVSDPMSIVKDLEEGSITREQVEAVKTVYPEIYAEIQGQVMEQLQRSEKPVSYSKRLEIGILLDIPTDPSLIPQNILGLQESYKGGEQGDTPTGQQGAVNVTQGGLGKIDFADTAQTSLQKSVERRNS